MTGKSKDSHAILKRSKRVRDAIKNDAFGEANRVTFEYSQFLNGLVVVPFVDQVFRVCR